MRILKKKIIINPLEKVDFFSVLISSGIFTGFFPFASGTVGSLFGLVFFIIPGFSDIFVLSAITIAVFVLSIYTSERMMKRYGDDPSVVVIDEIIGMWITVLIVIIWFSESIALTPLALMISFLAFRIFDIFKLFPANYFDKMKSGFGIVMDDVVSGIYAGVLSSLVIILIKKLF
ncbi:MAG TPA: phosphatidylglycerophosphatase A [Ignavibacteria bacterium]